MAQKLNIKKITKFLNEEYKEYSRYSVEERAIPCLCDGLKPGARKILNAAFVGTLKDNKTYKMLAGRLLYQTVLNNRPVFFDLSGYLFF